jgi:hypothetical protein
MRSSAGIGSIILAIIQLTVPAPAQTTDDDLKIYAVNVVKTAPFEKQFTGYGIYLGQGLVITAAHVIGHWPLITHPRVLVAGLDLPAKIIKEGSSEQIDLALLSVEADRLPVSLLLRRNPLCVTAPKVGAEVVDVIPEQTARARIISPLSVAVSMRGKVNTLINTPENSGSGIFDVERKCLVGIMSAKVEKYRYLLEGGRLIQMADGYAGIFVSAAKIADFMPAELHF